MSAELVLLHHNEPMTTSLAIAEGTENTHESVIKLVRKYVEDLQEFGTFGFEIQKSGGRPTEIAFLNEQQATLLITYLRNTDTVRRFKIALVKAFFEMRDRLRVVAPVSPMAVDHRADVLVSADRTFRAMMRSARACGLRLPQALRRANEITARETGIDMLRTLDAELPPEPFAASDYDPGGAGGFVAAWLAGELPVPCVICKTTDFSDAYSHWCAVRGISPASAQRLFVECHRRARGLRKTTVSAIRPDGQEWKVRAIVPPGALAGHENHHKGALYTASIARFAEALAAWRAKSENKTP
jgi:phage regulator Rha-like protein